jgi:pimeloyl-ACP methyl ester carboxylesterase
LPVLAVGGQASTTGPLMADMMREVATNVTAFCVPKTGHWIAEENPDALLEDLQTFFQTL